MLWFEQEVYPQGTCADTYSAGAITGCGETLGIAA